MIFWYWYPVDYLDNIDCLGYSQQSVSSSLSSDNWIRLRLVKVKSTLTYPGSYGILNRVNMFSR